MPRVKEVAKHFAKKVAHILATIAVAKVAAILVVMIPARGQQLHVGSSYYGEC